MNVLAGNPNREVVVEAQMQNEDLFRQSSVESEKAAMFQELGDQSQTESSNQHKM
jgi:hypothetical protein